jgi:long-subunit acyl-CoA synthetase (AMP-forming)
MVSSVDQPLDTIPRLVAHHARIRPDSPAFREKEFGIWQSWSWAQSSKEIEDLALGFLDLGLAEGDHIAIIGRNRPYLYWAMVACTIRRGHSGAALSGCCGRGNGLCDRSLLGPLYRGARSGTGR